MNKLLIAIVLLGLAYGAFAGDARVRDSAGFSVGRMEEVLILGGNMEMGGVAHSITGSDGFVRFRFNESDPMNLHHYARIWYTNANCQIAGGAVFFGLETNVNPNDTISAEGRTAIKSDAQVWLGTVSGSSPITNSYEDPMGGCVNSVQTIPGWPDLVREDIGRAHIYQPPFVAN